MTDSPRFETVERHAKTDGTGDHVFRNQPDFQRPMYPAMSEFAFKAHQVLSAFLKEWRETHADDNFAKGIELDVIPVMSEGMVMGFLGISEIDNASYDYLPAQGIPEENQ